MNERFVAQLKSEPKKELGPFFAARVAANARAERQPMPVWLRVYWIVATLLTLWILWRGHAVGYTMLAALPAGYLVYRVGWRRVLRRLIFLL